MFLFQHQITVRNLRGDLQRCKQEPLKLSKPEESDVLHLFKIFTGANCPRGVPFH